MMRSMYSGVSGLRVHQTKMDVIGNNIANVNTVGFKSQRTTFSDMYYQTLQGASAPNPATDSGGMNPMQIGLGVSVNSIDTIMTEGAAQRTDNPLDVKIEGDGFFIVGDASGTFFSRAGVFKVDSAGYLTTPDGMMLKGWPVDAEGKIAPGQVSNLQIVAPDKASVSPVITSNATVSGNLDKTDEKLTGGGTGVIMTVPFYDSLGYQYKLEFGITEGAADGEFKIKLRNIMKPDGTSWDAAKGPAGGPATKLGLDGAVTTIEVDLKFNTLTGKLEEVGGDAAKDKLIVNGLGNYIDAMGGPTDSKDITIDFSEMTMYAGKTNIDTKRGDKEGLGAGRAPGNLSGFTIGADGIVTGKYTNGDTRSLGQIAVANFANPEGLEKTGNNLFQATPNSGDFDGVGDDITSTGGALTSGVLEMSNVDLSKEFTNMIVTQRGYQANSKIITVSDELLQELVNLKR